VPLEQEVKLAFASVEAASLAVHAAGGRLAVSRRLIEDQLFDTEEGRLRTAGMALRLRRDGPKSVLTWKGPNQPGPVKSREEREVGVDDGFRMASILAALDLKPCFRSQKYREEYRLRDALVTIDETPAGVFVEIEAPPDEIDRVARQLERGPDDYRLESYPALWREWCREHGRPFGDMVFSPAP
jgi:predicted adenylyl cyclase CyaB